MTKKVTGKPPETPAANPAKPPTQADWQSKYNELSAEHVKLCKECDILRAAAPDGEIATISLTRDMALGSGNRKKGETIATMCCVADVTFAEIMNLLRNPQLQDVAILNPTGR